MKQLCYFGKVCDLEFIKKHKGVYLFYFIATLFTRTEIENFVLKMHKVCFKILGITS